MRIKTMSAITLVLPFLLLGCDMNDPPATTSAAPGEERRAMAPDSSPERTMERAPPAAGTPTYGDQPAASPDTPPAAAPAGSSTIPADSPATPQR